MPKKSFKIGSLARLYRGVNLNYRPYVWLDLWGDSYHGVPDTPARRKRLAKQLREAAKWVAK